jgi:hypothetical protein
MEKVNEHKSQPQCLKAANYVCKTMKSGDYMTGSSSFINTICNFLPLHAGSQVSYPHTVTGKITVLYISVFMFLGMP